MVIFNELFQTVRLSKWYIYFDTLSCSMKTFDSSVKAKQKVSTHLTEEQKKYQFLAGVLKMIRCNAKYKMRTFAQNCLQKRHYGKTIKYPIFDLYQFIISCFSYYAKLKHKNFLYYLMTTRE